MLLIDSPVMQRLRDIHQTGLAFQVYPSARHTRFEHSIGTSVVASRIFDAVLQRQRTTLNDIVKNTHPTLAPDEAIKKLRQELRLAALLHDTGHSLFSHTSELIYEHLLPLSEASEELSSFVGKEKGAGEVISFCLTLTQGLAGMMKRGSARLIGVAASDDFDGEIDLSAVALFIVGRSPHPFLQFLGDVVSSGFDADKLDYLLRDAKTAGLPLSYDIDRYLYDVAVKEESIADGESRLEKMYATVSQAAISPKKGEYFPAFDTYRLRLSRRAMNVIEQIIICKMMLFSYIYHHGKVRAAEGLLSRLLQRCVDSWRNGGESDDEVLRRFLRMSDASLRHELASRGEALGDEYAYRIINRLIPREIFAISGPSASHAQAPIVKDFIADLQDRTRRERVITALEAAIGEELLRRMPCLGDSADQALAKAGVWVDAPKPPKFEDVDNLVQDAGSSGARVAQIFPIREWTQAYAHYRYEVRFFSFSEYAEEASKAAQIAMTKVLGIESQSFYDGIRTVRR